MTEDAFTVRSIDEADLTEREEAEIRALLARAFVDDADFFATSSWWGSKPESRLVITDRDGALVAHLDIERRAIDVGGSDVMVAGVGEVSTDPQRHGQGIGRRLLAELDLVLAAKPEVAFGFLQCSEQVAGFYRAAGWHRIATPVRLIDVATHEWTISNLVAMIRPVHRSVEDWPVGAVDLRGYPW